MSKFSEIVAAVRASWPAYAAENGRPGTEVPPVRDGGNTAALIDLAVQTTLDNVAAESDGKAYRIVFPHGYVHLKLYKSAGYARNAKSNMHTPYADKAKVQELKGTWVDLDG